MLMVAKPRRDQVLESTSGARELEIVTAVLQERDPDVVVAGEATGLLAPRSSRRSGPSGPSTRRTGMWIWPMSPD